MNDQKIYVSEEGLDKFEKELYELINFRRKEVTERIEEAIKMGDLSENAEYDAAKNEQAFIEGRIAELQDLTRRAVVIGQGSHQNSGYINVGSIVKVKNNGDTLEYTIVGVAEADPFNGKISNESPLGKAFLGKRAGDKIDVNVPKGMLTYTILEIK